MFRIVTLAGIISLLLTSESFAFQVTCRNDRGPANSTIISYTIKDTDSHRLGSDISLRYRNQDSIISFLSVAQYLAQKNVLYFMVDDASENRILEFKGKPNCNWKRGKFNGVVREIANGRLVAETKLNCSITN